MAGIGSAAHGKGLLVLARHLVVSVDQRADGRGVRVDVEGNGRFLTLEYSAVAGGKGVQFFLHGLGGDTGGISNVDGLAQPAVFHGHRAADAGQRSEYFVLTVNAGKGSVGHAQQCVLQLQKAFFFGRAQVVLQQIIHHQGNGVDGALRQRSVAALAVSGDADKAFALAGHLHPVGVGQLVLVGLYNGKGAVRHHVGCYAAFHLYQIARQRRTGKGAAVVPLLTVTHREFAVRREAESGLGVVGQIIVHVLHAGLLGAAQQDAQGVRQGLALFFEELGGVQRQHSRSLVVRSAAADHEALALHHGERVGVPAVALGNHIQMGDGGNLLFAFAFDFRVTHVALAVVGVQAEAARHLQGGVQGFAHARTKGGAGLSRALHAVDVHECFQIAQKRVSVFFNECVNFLNALCIVHFSHSPCCLSFLSLL